MNQREFDEAYLNPFPEPPDVGECLLIVSRDYRQAKFLANQLRLPPTLWKFMSEVRDLMGWKNARIFYYADWYLRDDAHEVKDYIDVLLATGRCKMFTEPPANR